MFFFTQSCSVNSIYFQTHEKFIELALSKSEYLWSEFPKLAQGDLPTFLYKYESYPGYFDIVVNQFDNIGKADWTLANSIYELEKEVMDWLVTIFPLKTIGPLIPPMLLDKRLKEDKEYGLSTCANLESLKLGKQIHVFIVRADIDISGALGNTLISMYAKSGAVEIAQTIVELRGTSSLNVIAFTSLLNGYVKIRDVNPTREIFDSLKRRDVVVWTAMIIGYA
ncbi:hypothetical protein RYX36_025698 [Vicia faba]